MEFERFLESRRGKYPHACLLVGQGDLRQKAVTLAAEMMGDAGRRKVLAGIHPDVTILESDGGVIKVEPVRALRADIFIRPNEGDRKIFIILNADTMNINASNALLKVLEEPPSYGCFILTAQNAAALPETVLSRCVKITVSGEKTPEDSIYSAHLNAMAEALCEKNEANLFTALFPLEAAGRNSVRAFCAEGAQMMASALELSSGAAVTEKIGPGERTLAEKFSPERLARMGRFLSEIAADTANMNPGILVGFICAGLWDEAFSNNPPTERNFDI